MNRLIRILILLIFLAGRSFSQPADTLQRFEFSHKSMGTIFRIVCYAYQAEKAQQISDRAFERIDELNYIMSDYLPDSELNRLSRNSGSGKYTRVSSDLYVILSLGQQWGITTNGIFDITIGPYSQLWRRAGRKEKLPTPDQIKSASESVGYKYIQIDKDSSAVKLCKERMQLDLGGIAKGYTVDVIYDMFVNSGIKKVLVDGGGDIRVGDPPPGKKGWGIVMENLVDDNHLVYISNTSIATSGDLYRYVQIDSIKYGHIIDPRTGYGLTIRRTVTIQASNCTEADVLASTISIWGAEEGFNFLDDIPDVKAVVVEEEDGNVRRYVHGSFDFFK